MSLVKWLSAVGGDDSSTSDDTSPITGLLKGGYRTRLIPAFQQFIKICQAMVALAAQMQAAAASVFSAPGTAGNSTTSLAIGTGVKNLTIEVGKGLFNSQTVVIGSKSDASKNMVGLVNSYNPANGALQVTVSTANGPGAFADWTVSLTASGGIPLSRTITATGLATGAGDMSADRAINVAAASASEVAAGDTAAKAATPKAIQDALAPQVLVDQATITWDWAKAKSALAVLGGNRLLGKPTNYKRGDVQQVEIWQDATGTRLLTYHACYEFGRAGVPVLSTGAGKMDLGTVRCIDDSVTTPRFRISIGLDA